MPDVTLQLAKTCSTCKFAIWGESDIRWGGKKQGGMCCVNCEPKPQKPKRWGMWFHGTPLKDLAKKGEFFHHIAGTHATNTESLLKRVMINKKGKIGFKKAREIGGTLDFAEPINFLLEKDWTYQVNLRDEVYGIDMGKLNALANDYEE